MILGSDNQILVLAQNKNLTARETCGCGDFLLPATETIQREETSAVSEGECVSRGTEGHFRRTMAVWSF